MSRYRSVVLVCDPITCACFYIFISTSISKGKWGQFCQSNTFVYNSTFLAVSSLNIIILNAF